MTLSFGVMLPTNAPRGKALDFEAPLEIACWAEKRGLDSAWVGDRIFSQNQVLEALTVLSMVAATTRRIRIGSCVLLLPMRQLGIVAKQTATLALMSKGRFNLGVGVGGEHPDEWEAVGVRLDERGARLDESVPLLRRLFSGEHIDFTGRFTRLPGVRLDPTPPRIPILFGGRTDVALERAARLGDGWIGFLHRVEGFRRSVKTLTEHRSRAVVETDPFELGMLLPFRIDANNDNAEHRAAELFASRSSDHPGRTPVSTLQKYVIAGTPARVAEQLSELAAVGCSLFVMHALESGKAGREQLEALVSDVIPLVR